MNVYYVDSVETSFTVDAVTEIISDELALELVHGKNELAMIISKTCTASLRDMTISKKIAQLLNLETAAVHLALMTPLEEVEPTFFQLNIMPSTEYDEDEDEFPAGGYDGPEALLVTFDPKATTLDFSDIFVSAEYSLRDAGFRTTLSHAPKYRLGYKPGMLSVAESGDLGCMPRAGASSTPIHIPAAPNYPPPSYDSTYYNVSDDSTNLDALGEFFVSDNIV